MGIGAICIIFYLIPLIIVLIGTGRWVQENKRLATPLLLLAFIPGFNLLASLAVVLLLIARALLPRKIL